MTFRWNLLPAGRELEPVDMSRLAEQLVASAAGQGVQFTGEGGLLTALTRQVLQTALEAEMAAHLGYGKRDRAGTFGPRIVPKHQRRIAGFDEAIILLYVKGMTTGDIAEHLVEARDGTTGP